MTIAIDPTPGLRDLRATFAGHPGRAVGVEVECGVVDPRTGVSRPYEGRHGTAELLDGIRAAVAATGERAEPEYENGRLLGIRLGDGDQFSLEMGGALEYSSAVCGSVCEVVEHTARRLRAAAAVADRLGSALLSGGYLPFTRMPDIPWIPKKRLGIMRRFFSRLGEGAVLCDAYMGLTLSTQVTLDYGGEDDFSDKLRTVNLAAPVAAAMFVNSPLEDGDYHGSLSRRMRCGQHIDPTRYGVLPYAVDPPGVDDAVAWALHRPMIFRDGDGDGSHRPAPLENFDELRSLGFGDGTRPTLADWASQLSQVWPYVRVRDTIEVRVCDGPPWPDFGAVPAFWTGLLYYPPAREGAVELLAGMTGEELGHIAEDVARYGLAARVGRRTTAGDLCRELLYLSDRGLAARVRDGLERPAVRTLLNPLWRITGTGQSFAENCLERWRTDLRHSPERYVAAYRVR